MPEIKYGNLEGLYFSQAKIDQVLLPLAVSVSELIPQASDFEIWYDPHKDYHHLKFAAGGKTFDIRYYKILAFDIDGVPNWARFQVGDTREFVRFIKRILED